MEITFQKIVACLMHSRTQAHVYHWQTESYAQHTALDDYYINIVSLTDKLVEVYQGKYSIQKGYSKELLEYQLDEVTGNAPAFFDLLVVELEKYKIFFADSYMANIFDEILELTYQTKYKLDNLK